MYSCIDILAQMFQSRCEVIMYTTALVTFMAIGGFPSFVEDIKVMFYPDVNWNFLQHCFP